MHSSGHLQPQCLSVVLMIKHYLFLLNQCHCCGFRLKKCLKQRLTLLCSFNCRSQYIHITHMPMYLFILDMAAQNLPSHFWWDQGVPFPCPLPTLEKSKHTEFISEIFCWCRNVSLIQQSSSYSLMFLVLNTHGYYVLSLTHRMCVASSWRELKYMGKSKWGLWNLWMT